MTREMRDDSSGFTLIELLVTMFVIAGCLLGLIAMQLRALETTTLAKQRQQATQLANRTMEQLRALPYATVADGVGEGAAPHRFADDVNLVQVSGVWHLRGTLTTQEQLVVRQPTAASAATAPLAPHMQPPAQTTVGTTVYRLSSYVTWAQPSTPAAGFWLTVIVRWDTPLGTKTVSVRSRIFGTPL